MPQDHWTDQARALKVLRSIARGTHGDLEPIKQALERDSRGEAEASWQLIGALSSVTAQYVIAASPGFGTSALVAEIDIQLLDLAIEGRGRD